MRLRSVRTRGEHLQRVNITQWGTHTHTHWRTVHCSQHISTLSLDCLNTTGGKHDLRAQVGTSERETEKKNRKRKTKMIEGVRGREKRRPSMTSKQITHSPELLFSCYHFPRQPSFYIRLAASVTLVCLKKWQCCKQYESEFFSVYFNVF